VTPEELDYLAKKDTSIYDPCQVCGTKHGEGFDDVDICTVCGYQPIFHNPTDDPTLLEKSCGVEKM